MSQEQDVRTLALEQAYEMFISEGDDGPSYNDVYQEARYGITLKFDIYEHLQGHIQVRNKTGKVFIRGKAYDSDEFYTELEQRNKVIKAWLEEHTQAPQLTEVRKGIVPEVAKHG